MNGQRATPDPVWLSIVIPNLDGGRWLSGCLPSILANPLDGVEIIVADDGSIDGSEAICATHDVRFLAPRGRATGFAATANRGVAAASGTWVFLLNNDTELEPTTINALRSAIERNPGVAMFAPLVRSLRTRDRLDSAGLLMFPDGTARPRWHGVTAGTVEGEREVLAPSGAAAVYARRWLDTVEPFDEGMVSYGEDLDLALRIQRLGGTAVLVPSSVIYHYFSGTTGALSPAKARHVERNHIVIAVRHLPMLHLALLPISTLLRWAATATGVARSRRRGASTERPAPLAIVMAVTAGTIAGVAQVPRALRDRRRLLVTSRVTRREWRRLLGRHRAGLRDYLRFGE